MLTFGGAFSNHILATAVAGTSAAIVAEKNAPAAQLTFGVSFLILNPPEATQEQECSSSISFLKGTRSVSQYIVRM